MKTNEEGKNIGPKTLPDSGVDLDLAIFYRSTWAGLLRLIENAYKGSGRVATPSTAKEPALYYSAQVGSLLRFFTMDAVALQLTEQGYELARALNAPDSISSAQIMRSALYSVPRFRATVDILRQKLLREPDSKFTPVQLARSLREIDPSFIVADQTMRLYAMRFFGWMKAAGLARRATNKAYAFVRNGESPSSLKAKAYLPRPPVAIEYPQAPKAAAVESERASLPLYQLNALVADLLSDSRYRVHPARVEHLLNAVERSGTIDRVLLSILRRELQLALETHDRKMIALVGRTLTEIRRTYLEQGNRALETFTVEEADKEGT